MSKPISALTAFQNQTGPIPLSQLDANFTSLFNAANDMATYSNYMIDSSGATNLITVTPAVGLAFAYAAGISIEVKVANTNTSTTVNINVNALGNQLLKNPDGTSPAVGQIVAGGIYALQYDGTNFQIIGTPSAIPVGKFGDGSAAAPSITFASDTALGLYKAGTDILGITTAGVQRGTVNATGNWAINAPSAGTSLSVIGIQGILAQLSGPNTGAGWNVEFFDSTNSVGRGFIGIGTNTVTGAAVTDFAISPGGSGSVVIGTANGAAIGTRFGPAGNVTVSAPTSGTTLALTGIAGNNWITAGDGTVTSFWGDVAASKLIFGASSNHGVSLYSNNLERVAVAAAGNVTVNAPSSGIALTVFGITGTHTQLNGPNTGAGWNVAFFDTTNAAFRAFVGIGTNTVAGAAVTDFAISPGASGSIVLGNANGGAITTRSSATGQLSTADDGGTLQTVGWRDCPNNSQTASYQLALSDRGKSVDFNGASLTCTIPANGTTAFPIGTAIVITNLNASNLSIAITTDTLTLSGTTTTGTRTLAQNGMATILKVTSTSWLISGAGIS